MNPHHHLIITYLKGQHPCHIQWTLAFLAEGNPVMPERTFVGLVHQDWTIIDQRASYAPADSTSIVLAWRTRNGRAEYVTWLAMRDARGLPDYSSGKYRSTAAAAIADFQGREL